MKEPKLFIGPMSLNVVDSILELSNEIDKPIGIIPSRRQVEYNGGYVNNWTTRDFSNYIRSKSNNILLVRDHGGPNQGDKEDDGILSFKHDCEFFDVLHIDVWKKYKDYDKGLKETIKWYISNK